MSAKELADLLDELVQDGKAVLNESARSINAMQLAAADATRIARICNELQWVFVIYDGQNHAWAIQQIDNDLSPYRIAVTKPEMPADVVCIVTTAGFRRLLQQGHDFVRWKVATIRSCFRTQGRIFEPWGENNEFVSQPSTKSPRAIVQEQSDRRFVPENISLWLMVLPGPNLYDCPASLSWVNVASRKLILSLADEVLSDGGVKLRGPPKLTLSIPEDDFASDLGQAGFDALTEATTWVYENSREAEMRHSLLSTELSRSGGRHSSAVVCVRSDISSALSTAKIAYKLALSELGKDTLKALAELRKSVADETAKVSDTSRQIVASIAGAIAAGLGLIVARLTTPTHPAVVTILMIVVFVYVATATYSAEHFVRLQRSLRVDWRPRIYRFLSEDEYESMVGAPTAAAERILRLTSLVGTIAIAVLTAVVIYISWSQNMIPAAPDVSGVSRSTPQFQPPPQPPAPKSAPVPPV